MSLNPTLTHRILDYICRATTPAALTAPILISLHTATPGTTGASEVTNAGGSSYARQSAGFNPAASGSSVLSVALSYTNMPTATVTHIGYWDSAGLFLMGVALVTPQALTLGNTLSLTAATTSLTG